MTPHAAGIGEVAATLERARRERRPVARLITSANATLAEGYRVQRELMLCVKGGPYGFKIGSTSAAAMARIGIAEPLYGFIEASDAVANGGTIAAGTLIAPRIEMEVAFVLGADLGGDDCDAARALAATEALIPALEILDSRYEAGPFDVVAAVADNMSTARHVLGTERLDPRTIDPRTIAAVLEKNGTPIAHGSGAAVLGNPAESLAWLVRTLAQRGDHLARGSVILTGGFADALPAAGGDTFVARFTPGGTVACTFARAGGNV